MAEIYAYVVGRGTVQQKVLLPDRTVLFTGFQSRQPLGAVGIQTYRRFCLKQQATQ
jgi:hypothetical protein